MKMYHGSDVEVTNVDLVQLLESLKYKKVTYQYCFKTMAAVSFLKSTDK